MLGFALCALAAGITPPAEQWVQGYTFGASESHPHAGVQLQDGGYLVVGDGVDYANTTVVKRYMYAMKADASGALLWQARVGECGYNYGKSGVELSDGTLLLGGAISDGCKPLHPDGVLHRGLVRLDGATGRVLNTQLLPNTATGADKGRRDGIMNLCVSDSGGGDANHTVAATGFVGGESAKTGYPDEPMFLVHGGAAVLTKFSYAPWHAGSPKSSDLDVVFDATLDAAGGGGAGFDGTADQGMRLVHDAPASRYVVSSTGVSADDPDGRFQMSLFSARDTDGATQWAKTYPASAAPEGGHASHPYALTKMPAGGAAAFAIGGLAVLYDADGIEQCQGRALGLDQDGEIAFDARFAEPGAGENTECYGIIPSPSDGGAVLTCGAGVEPELHPKDTDKQKTWRVLLHGLDSSGAPTWQKTYTDAQQRKLQNNAGENLIRTSDGGIAVLVDSETWGSPSTGGNFALMKLAPEAGATVAAA